MARFVGDVAEHRADDRNTHAALCTPTPCGSNVPRVVPSNSVDGSVSWRVHRLWNVISGTADDLTALGAVAHRMTASP